MIMKKNIFAIFAALAFLCSCSLKEKPTNFVNNDNYYETVTQCQTVLNSCYIPLKSIYQADFLTAVEGCTDIWQSTSGSRDAVLDITPANPGVGGKIWRECYLGIQRCNECIECIGKAMVAMVERDQMVAEARVLRALYYYNLTCFFGNVPYYTFRIGSDADLMKVERLPRTDASIIRTELYNDIKENSLPVFLQDEYLTRRTAEVADQRAGYALGLMLMAKMAMWNEDWSGAMDSLRDLQTLYGTFDEEHYPLAKTLWREKNAAESIFEVQHAAGLDWGDAACIMTPPCTGIDRSGRLTFDGVVIPEIGNQASCSGSLQANAIFGAFRPEAGTEKKEVEADTAAFFHPLPLTFDSYDAALNRYTVMIDRTALGSVDKRIMHVLGLGCLDTLDTDSDARTRTFSLTRKEGLAWAGSKFWCPDQKGTADANNYHIFRYADAILMMAECCINLGEPANAASYINLVRARAGVSPVAEGSKEELTSALRSERARELGGEFQRKFDLVRWGVWYEQTLAHTGNAALKANIRPCHKFYPIPESECTLSGNVLTNDEYKL